MEDDLFGGLLFAEPAPPPAATPAPKATKPPAKETAKAKSGNVEQTAAKDESEAKNELGHSSKEPAHDRAAQNERDCAPGLASDQKSPKDAKGEESRSGEEPVHDRVAPVKEPTAPPSKALEPQKQLRRVGSDDAPIIGSKTPWPEALQGTPSISVLENAIAKNRLAHGLLLHGDDFSLLTQVALALADRLLNTPESTAYFPPAQHPDCFALRPSGASRQVSADDTRELIGKTQVSGSVSPRKVAILYECDRMNLAAANIFLKTLEEPPANTTLLLLTTQPYALLPTVRSRVLHFRFPVSGDSLGQAAGLPAWLSDYQAWLGQLCEGVSGKRDVADSVFTLYGLVARFDAILAAATAEAWETEKNTLPEELDKEEQKAVEKRLANGIRQRIFAEIEQATRAFALPRLTGADTANAAEAVARTRRAHTAAISELEHSVGLLRLNLNHAAALENFLLHSMRLWARR